jgi:hypothetical protein
MEEASAHVHVDLMDAFLDLWNLGVLSSAIGKQVSTLKLNVRTIHA